MKIVVTGAYGYVGQLISSALQAQGWSVETLKNERGESWRFLQDLPKEKIDGATTLVHAAWEMTLSSKKAPFTTNVIGSKKLIQQAIEAGIKQLIFISTMSCYEGCSSHYGQEKLYVEKKILEAGGIVVRLGLVYGHDMGGMMGKLLSLVKKLSVIPLPCVHAKQYLTPDTVMKDFMCQAVEGKIPTGIYSLVDPTARSTQEIILGLAESLRKKVFIIPFPWQLAWLGLFISQGLGLRLPIHTDNLIGLAKANPHPDFSSLQKFHIPLHFDDGLLACMDSD